MFMRQVVKQSPRHYFRSTRIFSTQTKHNPFQCPLEDEPKPLNAFEILNLEPRFDLNDDVLKQSYRSLMANLHPDKHQALPLSEQETMRQKASEVTQSYQILKNIPTRATHLLQTFGKVEDMDEASLKDLLAGTQATMLLMEIMEIREAIEDTDNKEGLKQLQQENNVRLDNVYNELAEAFANGNLDLALELTVKLQYYNRIDESIREKM